MAPLHLAGKIPVPVALGNFLRCPYLPAFAIDLHRLLNHGLHYQTCYNNSTEVLFAAMTIYHLRIIERLWGSRKFAVRFRYPTILTTRFAHTLK